MESLSKRTKPRREKGVKISIRKWDQHYYYNRRTAEMLAVMSHYKCLCHIICPLPMHAIVHVSQQARPLLLLATVISILVMLAIMMQSLCWLLSGCSGADRWCRQEGSFSSLNPIVARSSSPKTLPRHGCPVSSCASMIFKPALGSFQASSKGGYCANTILRVINGYRTAHRRSKSPQGSHSISQYDTITMRDYYWDF